jgi:pimeloyl-ACP methyl ester carboxylesterase
LSGEPVFNLSNMRGLLAPERVAISTYPSLSVADVGGGKISYALLGLGQGPLIVYFHGWGDDFRAVLALEYPLIDAGFRLLVVHRPGYAGTTLAGEVDGEAVDWRTAGAFAKAAAGLLDHLYGADTWHVSVIGTSGGAPTALAFAEFHPRQTAALLLQAGVTQPWTEAKFLPQLLRNSYRTAFRRFGWAGEQASQIVFGLLVKVRDYGLSRDDKLEALTGAHYDEAKRDPAFAAVAATMLREDSGNRRGELNDVFEIFFAHAPYCRWESIEARTLLVHDPDDPFVPFVHAELAARRVAKAQVRPFHLAGHILWLGPDARAMHDTRVDFLRRR